MSASPTAAPSTASAGPSRFGVDAGHASYKWWALSCTSLGMLLAATNSGTLIIALPDLERSLHTSLLALVWVILAYLIAATVLVLMAGRLSDLFGRKRAYVGGFLVFALASLGAGFSGDATVLILWRILQGIGSAFLFANAAALVTDAFPKEQLGLAMGANTMVAAIGLVLGPVLGGALVAISWHWVFWFNVPFALAGAAWGALILRELAKPDTVRGYDVLGTSTFVIGLTGLVYGVSRGGISGWNDSLVIGALIVAAVLLPLWVAIERRSRAPMLDLGLFKNRLFAAASAASFLNGLARFALMFLFVFYYQGAQGNSPIEAGIKLIPLALGMLIASPIAGIYADRHGSRALAAIGMLVTAAGLAGMTTLDVHTAYWQSGLWLLVVGVGSGMFNSPNTAAMMGVVPAHRRGIAAGARTLLQNTGAVLSIAFVLAIVTSAVPKATLFAVFSGLAQGLSAQKLAPFIENMHVALWVLAGTSLLGAGVCLLRPGHADATADADAATAADQRSPIRPWEEALADEAFVPGRDETVAGERPSPLSDDTQLGVRA
ncbi:MAG TPA: MFS transporter [Solirubrobacteraceae bacterium]|jgi:EmrB/QacA subfamily drug resistance transporter|nr:MFS transporter [Solirubrobacteraceae bacterium]